MQFIKGTVTELGVKRTETTDEGEVKKNFFKYRFKIDQTTVRLQLNHKVELQNGDSIVAIGRYNSQGFIARAAKNTQSKAIYCQSVLRLALSAVSLMVTTLAVLFLADKVYQNLNTSSGDVLLSFNIISIIPYAIMAIVASAAVYKTGQFFYFWYVSAQLQMWQNKK